MIIVLQSASIITYKTRQYNKGIISLIPRFSGPRLHLIGTDFYLAGTDLYLVGTRLYLIGTDLYLVGTDLYLDF